MSHCAMRYHENHIFPRLYSREGVAISDTVNRAILQQGLNLLIKFYNHYFTRTHLLALLFNVKILYILFNLAYS